ncbi:MAG: hypothetical protein IPI04_05775 [Ignavibacteria bacterium]|nr:hypothetical protein [Ignavibacteria bacterium]
MSSSKMKGGKHINETQIKKFESFVRKFTASAIIKGYASYTAFKRDFALDLKYAWEAYKEAIHQSKNWISEYKKEDEYSAVIYKTRYLGSVKKTELTERQRTCKIHYHSESQSIFKRNNEYNSVQF